MADVETYGGKCPKCEKSMMQKGDTGIGNWFSYDACPWCGFAYGEAPGEGPCTQEKIWISVLNHCGAKSREELIQKYGLPETVPQDECDFFPSVFRYTAEAMEEIERLNKAAK